MNASDTLQNLFNFSPSDLDANRRGELSDWQRRRLKEKQAKARLGFVLPAIPVVFIVLFGRSPTAACLIVIFVAAAGYLSYVAYKRWRSLQADSQLTSGVESVYGWTSKSVRRSRNSASYWLDVNGNKFQISHYQFTEFVGGLEYRLFYAPASRTILSIEAEESRGNQPGYFAERLGTPVAETMSSQANLQSNYFFSADDLNANRRGVVTDGQIARLRKLRRQSIPLLILAVLAAGLAIGVRNDALWLSLLMVAFIVLLVAAAIGFWRRFDRESKSPQIAVARGPASKRYRAGRNRRFFLRVGEVEFTVMVYQYNAVTEGRSYRVYYAPITRTILSIEADE